MKYLTKIKYEPLVNCIFYQLKNLINNKMDSASKHYWSYFIRSNEIYHIILTNSDLELLFLGEFRNKRGHDFLIYANLYRYCIIVTTKTKFFR